MIEKAPHRLLTLHAPCSYYSLSAVWCFVTVPDVVLATGTFSSPELHDNTALLLSGTLNGTKLIVHVVTKVTGGSSAFSSNQTSVYAISIL